MSTTTAEVDSRTVAEKIGRDTAATGKILERWLSARIEGAEGLEVFDFAMPQGAGMSNETLLFRARWTKDGQAVVRGLAARVAPSAIQLFKDANLRTQFDLLHSLYQGGHVKVAEPLWFEEDASLLGQPFYVMQRMEGRVPVSFPPYNVAGFLFDASVAERRRLWESAMDQLCRIAVTPLEAAKALVREGEPGDGFEQHLSYWLDSCRWVGCHHAPAMMEIETWLLNNRPKDPLPGLSWGDARIGNMMFDRDFQLLGVMDWEQASLGGAMQDLAWWLFFDDFHSRYVGVKRLDGLGARQETVDFWCDRTGRRADQLQWYEAFAGYKLAIIMSRGFSIDRKEQPGGNIGNNICTRAVAEIIGVDQPQDAYLPGSTPG